MPGPQPSNPYLRTKILTASPEELRLMLYDGALRFCQRAKEAFERQDWEVSYDNLMRTQKIVLELSTSLNHQIDPELCGRLGALYTYIYRRLVDANMSHDPTVLNETIELLEYERETWRMLMERLAKDGQPVAGEDRGAQQTAISSLSVNG